MENWIAKESLNIDTTNDVAILENPEKKQYIDNLLIKKFWPKIKCGLKATGYGYSPKNSPETDFEFSFELTRSLTFMLFNGIRSIFRGKLSCSATKWMLHSEFFLGLHQDTSPYVVFKILEDKRFSSIPPILTIYKDMPFDYFHITFENGSGASWGLYDYDYIYNRINLAIDINARLYDFLMLNSLDEKRVEEFLLLASQVYGAY
jgi:hypothetical protein